jgi:group I intron endonuclease
MINFNCGVYAIYGPNGRAYIGSTVSFSKRFGTHRRELKKGEHHCRALQRAYDKYGEHAFTYAKIAIVPASNLLTAEQVQMVGVEHDFHSDWVGERFDASVDAAIDAAIEGEKND